MGIMDSVLQSWEECAQCRRNVHNESTPNLHFEICLYKMAPLVCTFRAIPYGGCVSHEASFRKVEDSCLLCGLRFYIGYYMEV